MLLTVNLSTTDSFNSEYSRRDRKCSLVSLLMFKY